MNLTPELFPYERRKNAKREKTKEKEQAMISLQGMADFLANTCTVGIQIADIQLTEPFG